MANIVSLTGGLSICSLPVPANKQRLGLYQCSLMEENTAAIWYASAECDQCLHKANSHIGQQGTWEVVRNYCQIPIVESWCICETHAWELAQRSSSYLFARLVGLVRPKLKLILASVGYMTWCTFKIGIIPLNLSLRRTLWLVCILLKYMWVLHVIQLILLKTQLYENAFVEYMTRSHKAELEIAQLCCCSEIPLA